MLESVAQTIFEVCNDKSLGTKQCVEQVINKLGVIPSNQEAVEKAIRDYRLSGKSLSATAEILTKAIKGCDDCSPFDNCGGCDPDSFGIKFDVALKHFTDRKFHEPKAAAVFVTQYLTQTIHWDEGEKLELDKVEEQYSGNSFSYNGLVYSCYDIDDLRDLTVDSVAECIAESAYDLAADEVSQMNDEEVAERYAGGYAADIKAIEDPDKDPNNTCRGFVVIAER